MRLELYNQMRSLTYISFAVLFFAFQHIPEIIYTSVTRRQFNAYSFKNLIDSLLFLLFFIYIIVSYGKNLNGSWKEQFTIGNQTRADIYARNFYSGAPKFEELLLLFMNIVIWFRVIYLLTFNTMFGTLWGII